MTEPHVSIVLPLHQQANQIAEIAEDYEMALRRLSAPYELLLIVNGSSDGTMAACDALTRRGEHVRAHELAEAGWGRAVRFGLAQARGEVLCYTNSARTSADDLLRLLQHGLAHPDVVVKASRKIRDNWRRRVGSLIFALECRALFDLANWDINGTPKVFPRAFGKLLELERDDDLIDLEFLAVCKREDYPVLEVPLLATQRHGGRSTTNYGSAARMYWGAYQLAKSSPDVAA